MVANLVEMLMRLADATSDEQEASITAALARRLVSENGPAGLEALVCATRDELAHHKGPFCDSLDQSETVLVLREGARDAAKRAVNFFVIKRRPDLGFTARIDG
ncbi:hypothetical protein GCM10007918_39350 [Piscinibacter gummiphilus]|nr:hypothetical protein GCM10007918_39350 [Piscinibacter gummiphilus]